MRRSVPLLLLALLACSDSEPRAPRRECALVVWYRATAPSAYVEVIGSWDGFTRPGRALPHERDDGWRAARLELPPGNYAYAIVEDGTWIADPNVPTSTFYQGKEVALATVPRCEVPALKVERASGSADGHAEIEASFVASASGDALSSARAEMEGRELPVRLDKEKIQLSLDGLPRGKHAIVVTAKDAAGKDAEPARATVWIEPRPLELADLSIYHVMVDRFRARDGSALAPPAVPSARAGGHIEGVRRSLDQLAAMGFNTVWLSPLYANPDGEFPGTDGRMYSSYHGYWPTDSRKLEEKIASEAELEAFMKDAHGRGMRVLFDVVPNHVHEQHAYARNASWLNRDGRCVCGSPACPWSTDIQECWFAPYLPDLDWRRHEVAEAGTADVKWWMDRWDADGVRIDAVPMMPRAATRRMAKAIRDTYDHPGNKTFLLGENFTGPGGYGLLRYHLGPFGLDSEFHFPLLWALRSTIADPSAPLTDIDASVRTGEKEWAGSGAVMGLTIGNHDVPRFATIAARDEGSGWVPGPQPTDPEVYAKQRVALGVVFTLPGVPVVYYGDEVALAGRADPDSRRVMPSEESLSAEQKRTRDLVSLMGRARACSTALRRGTYRFLAGDAEHLAYARQVEGEEVVVLVQRSVTASWTAALPGIKAGTWIEVVSGREASLSPELTNFAPGPFSISLFFPSQSACVSEVRRP